MKLVITGATGFIGTALVKYALKCGDEVYAVSRPGSENGHRLREVSDKTDNITSERLRIIECDIDSLKNLPKLIEDRCDIFYHMGWANTGRERNRTAEGQFINVRYIKDAVCAAALLGCKRFVGAGSQAEYGPKQAGFIAPDGEEVRFSLDELENGIPKGYKVKGISSFDEADPVGYYGKAKLDAMNTASCECQKNGMDFIWARIFSAYGTNDKLTTMISEGIIKMLKGEPTEFTKGLQIWDYMFVDDMARALYLSGTKGKDGAIYNLGSGEGRQLREYIEIMKDAIDPNINAGLGKRVYPESGVRNICADISLLTADTGFVPEISFEKGIRLTIDDIKNRVFKI